MSRAKILLVRATWLRNETHVVSIIVAGILLVNLFLR